MTKEPNHKMNHRALILRKAPAKGNIVHETQSQIKEEHGSTDRLNNTQNIQHTGLVNLPGKGNVPQLPQVTLKHVLQEVQPHITPKVIIAQPKVAQVSTSGDIAVVRSEVQVGRTVSEAEIVSFDKTKEPFKCAQCDYCSHNKHYLKQHVDLVHNAERPFKCPFCDYAGKRSHSLKEHLVVHSNNRPYECGFCNATFRKKGHLTNHIKMHTSQKGFACNLCQSHFENPPELYNHLRTSHSSQETYPCDVCDYVTTLKANIVMHRQSHRSYEAYKCIVCKFTTHQIGVMKDHLQIHGSNASYEVIRALLKTKSGVPLKCAECSFVCTDQAALLEHMANHVYVSNQRDQKQNGKSEAATVSSGSETEGTSGQTTYRCSDCHFTCAEAVTFITHMLSQHSPKLALDKKDQHGELNSNPLLNYTHDATAGFYRCTVCGYTSEHQRTIKAHMWRHSGNSEVDYPMFQNGPLSIYEDTPIGMPQNLGSTGVEMIQAPVTIASKPEKTVPAVADPKCTVSEANSSDAAIPGQTSAKPCLSDVGSVASAVMKSMDSSGQQLIQGQGAEVQASSNAGYILLAGNTVTREHQEVEVCTSKEPEEEESGLVHQSHVLQSEVNITQTNEALSNKHDLSNNMLPSPVQTAKAEANDIFTKSPAEMNQSEDTEMRKECQAQTSSDVMMWESAQVIVEEVLPVAAQCTISSTEPEEVTRSSLQDSSDEQLSLTSDSVEEITEVRQHDGTGISRVQPDYPVDSTSNSPQLTSSSESTEIVKLLLKTRSSLGGATSQEEAKLASKILHQLGVSESSDIVKTPALQSVTPSPSDSPKLIGQKRKIQEDQDLIGAAKKICNAANTHGSVLVEKVSQGYYTPNFSSGSRSHSPQEPVFSTQSANLGHSTAKVAPREPYQKLLSKQNEKESMDVEHNAVKGPEDKSGNPEETSCPQASPKAQEGSVSPGESATSDSTKMSDLTDEALTLLSLLKKGPNVNPACPPPQPDVSSNKTNRPKSGISSSLLAVIEHLRERSKSESEGDEHSEGTKSSSRSSRPRRRSRRGSTEDDGTPIDQYDNVEKIIGDDVTYRCKLCHYTSNSTAFMKAHVSLIHKTKKPFECSLCEYVAESTDDLQKHTLKHCKVRTYQCRVCSMSFVYKSQLRAHMRGHDDSQTMSIIKGAFPESQSTSESKSKHSCSVCNQTFPTKSRLSSHTCKLNKTSTYFVCQVCSFKAQTEAEFIEHAKAEHMAQEEKPDCNSSSDTEGSDKTKDKSSADVNLVCSMCGFTAISTRSLKSHMKRHINDQRFVQQPLEQYKCNLCGYLCHHLPSLKSHMWRHASDANYSYEVTNDVINAAMDYGGSESVSSTQEQESEPMTRILAQQTANGDLQSFITFRCCQCGFESENKSVLNAHMTQHNDIIQKTLEVNRSRILGKSEGQRSGAHIL